MRKKAILFMVCSIFVSFACENSLSSDQMVDLGSHRLHMHIEGKGTPAVVFDTGLGDQMDRLRPLQENIARVTNFVTYNRAGYGRSEPGPLPRHSGREAEELKALLEKAAVPGPYVLVGHSLGALNVQIFAARYPEDVAGIVLLDPPPLSFILGKEFNDLKVMAEQMTAEWQAIADSSANSTDSGERAMSAFFRMMASEHREMFNESAKMAGAISSFGDIPLVVMAAGTPNPAFGEIADEFQRFWIEQNRLLAEKSTNGRFILAEESSHHLYADMPELVAETILSVIRQVREK